MGIRTICDQGAINLAEAIVDRAVKDFMNSKPGSKEREEIEEFFLSDYFELITGANGSAFLKKLQDEYNKKHSKARKDR